MYGEIFREIRDFRVTIFNAEDLSFFHRDKNAVFNEVYVKRICLFVILSKKTNADR